MTKKDLINMILKSKRLGLSKKTTTAVVDAVFANIRQAVRKERRFRFPKFGTWVVRTRKARVGRNPQTGVTIRIKASKTVGFRPAKDLKAKI